MPSLNFDAEKANFRQYYDENLPLLEIACASIRTLINSLLNSVSSVEISKFESRVKNRDECTAKFDRKYRSSLEEDGTPYEIRHFITDLVGLRVVCLYEDNLPAISQLIGKHFNVLEVTNKAAVVENTVDSFGYKGLHMDLKLSSPRSELPEYSPYSHLQFELQIRTIVQDSWSVLDHKIKYKKSIPDRLKRRINVLAALFELADREFREIRDLTITQLREAPDETLSQETLRNIKGVSEPSDIVGDLNAFTFLKIASHFFGNYEFQPQKVDGFVQQIHTWSLQMTRARFNSILRDNIAVVKRYRTHLEQGSFVERFNPYTSIRHCLYLGDKTSFSRALTNIARERFEGWLSKHKGEILG